MSIVLPLVYQAYTFSAPPTCHDTLHQHVEAQVERTPDAIAITFITATGAPPIQLTYRELNQRANQLAHYLQALGLGQAPGDEPLIGLCLDRSPTMIIGLLAILKVGGAYVPLDPGYPPERLAFMLDDANLTALITQQPVPPNLPPVAAPVIDLTHAWPQIAQQPTTNPIMPIAPHHLAYVIYTSGSTGRPKGVLVEHGGLSNLVAVQQATFALRPGDRVLQFASPNFDASIWEIAMALCTGATLYLAPAPLLLPGPPLARFLADHAISHVTLIPTALAALRPEEAPALQCVIVAGEACPAALAQRWLTGRRFFNAYGPTETTVCATIMACQADSPFTNSAPIGQAIANVQLYLLDEAGQPTPPGEVGELYIGGATLARGYLNRPALTAEKFVSNPFGDPANPGRLYRTGDLVRQVGGTPTAPILEFLGRVDQQVKVRGFRIELGEIEARLAEHPQVQSAVVTAQSAGPATGDGQPQLVAYVVPTADCPLPPPDLRAALRHFLQARLPAYMLPAALVITPALPLMPNGKVNRQALPPPTADAFVTAPYQAPQRATERALATLWEELLGLSGLGRATDFFAAGGHSLLATQLLAQVRARFGCDLPMHALFATPTIAGLAALIDQSSTSAAPSAPPLQPGPRPARLPLAYAQQRLWFLAQVEGMENTYNEPFALRLEGPLAPTALQAALQAIVDRHEALRTTFPAIDGVPYQAIAPLLPIALPVIDLPAGDQPQTTAVQALLDAATWQPFDLTTGPLVRATLYRQSATDHLLLLVFHHIIVDGWSLGRLLAELACHYQAHQRHEAADLPPLPLQYADYALWQRAWLQGATLAAEQRYWQTQLTDAPTLLALPTDFPRPAAPSYRGGAVDFHLDSSLTSDLHRLCQAQAVTPFMVIYTAFALVLARYSGQEDLIIGATVANRQQPELDALIGFFVNTLALRADLRGNPTGVDMLARVRAMTLAAYAHQNLPFAQLVSELAIPRDPGYAPLCQVMLTFDNTHSRATMLGDLQVTPVALSSAVAKFDLTLSLTEQPTSLAATLVYNRDLFRAETIERLAGHFQTLLRALLVAPTTPIAQLPLLTPAEQHQLLVTWNQTRTPYPHDQTIHALFAAQAARTPTAVALLFAQDETGSHAATENASCLPVSLSPCLTYAELDAHANQLAHHLCRRGVGAGTLVGLYLDRSPLAVVALLGILKAGGAYVPLDPTYPAERLAWMVTETATPLILTEAARRADLPASASTLCLDSEWALITTEPTTAPPVTTTADSLAYVMFTSGSTGRPKGVCVSHRNVVRLVQQTDFVNLSADEVFLQLAPLAFDAATFEIWGALLNGARLVVMTPGQPSLAAIGAAICQHGVTTLWLTAGLFHLMVDEQLDALRPLRQLLAGGDVLSMAHVRRVLQTLPHCRLINGYGPTENTTFTCCYTFPPDPPLNAPAPIGRPIANSQVYLLDKALQPVPIGVPGELYAGGDGVAQGYLNHPALTAERFIDFRFGIFDFGLSADGANQKLYKTGDRARWLPNGVIEFLGRLDQQVKIRGFRVEPGEIEAILAQHPVVQSAAVVAQPAGNDKQLVAYLVVAEGAAPNLTDALRTFLQTKLPPYMLPSRFLYLDALPLTANGKVDRRALPLPTPDATATETADQSPQTPTEELLAAIWRTLLTDQPVGRQSDFFAIGGHSLLATQVVARVASTFGVAIGVRTLFETPTLAAFAAVIDQRRRMGQAGLVLPPLRPSHTQSMPLPLSFAQQRLWFLDQLEGASGLYNLPLALRLHGPLDERALHCALQQIVQRHAILRTTFPATDGVAAQVIAPTLDLPLPRLEIGGAGAAAEETLYQALQAELWRPFDLAAGPLLRATLYGLTPTEHLLALTFHHVIADGWSLAIFLDELAACYAAACGQAAAPLAPLPVQYADFTLWQRDWLQGETLVQQQAYWRQQLAHAPTLLTLPTDAPRPAVQSYRGGAVTQALPPALTAALQELSQREGVSLFMTCYAAWAVLLARYSGQEDLVIGAPIANRQQQALEPLIGFFVNTLPLRADLTGNPPFRVLLQRVCRLTLDAYAHQDIPFEQVVSDLGLPRSLRHAPLFQVMLAFNNVQPLRRTLADLTVTPVALAAVLPAVMARFDLTLHIQQEADGWQTTWEYNRDLFTAATIERMAGHFQTLLAAIVAAPATPIQQLSLLTPAERQQLLVTWNPPATPYPHDQTIHALFAAQAARTPTAMAAIFAEETETGRQEDRKTRVPEEGARAASSLPVFLSPCLTYAELDAYANQLAHYLRAAGVGPGALVGLCLERSPALLVGILGILKAGGAYVPLDPAYPLERLHFVCADTGMRVVVTEQALGDRFAQGDLQVICLDRDWALINRTDRYAPVTAVQPTDLAYVIYTSGSTGQPKGVMVTHRNLVHSTTARFRYYPQPVARFLLLSSFAFDSSVAGIFWTLCQGGALVLPLPGDEKDLARLAGLINDHGVTHLLALPSLYSLLLRYSNAAQLCSLQVAIVAGEACPPALPAQHRSTLPAATLYNEYGPTEGTVWSSVYRFPPAWQGAAVPISHLPQDALPNIQLYVLDHHQQPVPIGVPGELYIGGAGITPGYWQQPALTAEKFMADPFHPADPTARLYRTGDLVCYRADGHLDFLGRVDQQVKLRGFRIELGEIEAALLQHPQVQAAAVVIHQEQLVAYVVTRQEPKSQAAPENVTLSPCHPLTLSDLQVFLQKRLPDYMMPTALVALTALPLLPNGKVDRAALPAPTVGAEEALLAALMPRTAFEQQLAAIWQQLLGVAQVGRADNFFALGGHSLLLAQLAAHIRLTFACTVPLRTLFQSPTLAAMSAAITASGNGTPPPPPPVAAPTTALPVSPHRRYWAEPLAEAIQRGDLPPVDAAALAYWPDDLLHSHGLSPTTVVAEIFQGRPTVATILETVWGRIATIVLPRLHSELYVDPTLFNAIDEALALAGALGAQNVSLTGLLPSATDYGRAISRTLGHRHDRPTITTGHAMTAAAVVMNVEQIVQQAGRTLAHERLACLGLGSIGLSSLELLLQVAPHPQTILLCDLATRLPHLQHIGTALAERFGFGGEVQLVPVHGELPPVVYTASLMLGATNVPDVLDVERLPPGVLLVDDSGPHCFNPQRAIDRLTRQQDLLFTEGGAVALPTAIQQTIYTPPGLPPLFATGALDEPTLLMGCVLSSLASVRWPDLPPTLGVITPDVALAYYRRLRALGIDAAPLHCAGYRLPPALIDQFCQKR